MIIEGVLKEDGIDQWRVFLPSQGETISLAEGQLVELEVAGFWLATVVIVYKGRAMPKVRGLKFYHGQAVRFEWPESGAV